jgi:hypothetical protein
MMLFVCAAMSQSVNHYGRYCFQPKERDKSFAFSVLDGRKFLFAKYLGGRVERPPETESVGKLLK